MTQNRITKFKKIKIFKFSSKLFLIFSFLLSSLAFVQDSDGLEEVIVTAQRQEQSLQSVPLAVSSLDTDNESIYYRNLESTAVGNYQRIMARERARYGVRAGWNF